MIGMATSLITFTGGYFDPDDAAAGALRDRIEAVAALAAAAEQRASDHLDHGDLPSSVTPAIADALWQGLLRDIAAVTGDVAPGAVSAA